MAWLLVFFLYSLHIVQSSLPSFEEIKARTRWCLGEGKHCSVNLLQGFDFSLCCAPYVCTTILKDRKPNWLHSSEYQEHRCVLPPASTFNTTLGVNAINTSKEWRMDADQFVENFNKLTQANNTEAYELSTSESKSLNIEEQQSIESKNNSSESQSSYYSEEKEVQNIVKRSTDPGVTENIGVNLTSIEGTETIQSLGNISLSLTGNSSEDLTRVSFNRDNSTENYEDFGNNKTESVEYRLPTNYSSELSTAQSTDFSNMTVTAGSVQISTNQDFQNKNNVTSLNSTYSATSSEIFSDEDWHSSLMQYDTRPMLRKVVTVLPFHFFDSVKVIRINESIETSAD